MIFCAFQDLQNFVIGDIATHSAVDTVFRHVTDTNAEFSVDISGSFAAHTLLFAAGALTDGIFVIFVEPVGDVFHTGGMIFMLDGLFHRNDVHPDSGASERHHLCDVFQRHLGHQVEECGELRMFFGELVVHHHELCGAGNKDRNIVMLSFVLSLPGHLQHSDPKEVVDHLLRLFFGHAVALCDALGVIGNAGLFETEQELDLLLCEDSVKSPVFRIVHTDRVGISLDIPVGDHPGQFQDQFLLFRIRSGIIRVLTKIAFVGHPVQLIFHCLSSKEGIFQFCSASSSHEIQASNRSPVLADRGRITASLFRRRIRSQHFPISN